VSTYLAVIEGKPGAYGAYVPDLPGCVAAAADLDEVIRLIREAVPDHIRSLREHGEPVPPPQSQSLQVLATAS
jgi:predicted RNase H-like HicB family nuclease